MNQKNNKGILIYVLLGICIILGVATAMNMSNSVANKTQYSEIISYFDNYQVSAYTLDLGSGKLSMTVNGNDKPIEYVVPNVNIFIDDIQGEANYRLEYNKRNPNAPLKQDFLPIKDTSWLIQLIPTVILVLLLVGLFIFTMRQMGGGGKVAQFGKANVKAQSQSSKKTTFADVAGAKEEKEEMAEIVDFLKNPKKYMEIGARIPKGVLLLGPPGTGKTLLARAVAGEAGVPFFSISGSDFVEMYVGVGASRVRDLFETAKKNSPSIIFIDEIDAVGRQRGTGLGGGHDEREQTLNQLLVEMDGFAANDSVIVIAATNRRDILDPALLRPGRFDRQISVGLPDVKGREEILQVHTRNKPLAPDVELKVIARSTFGFTGADLENMVNEAALLAARENRKAITMRDIFEASIKVVAGPEKKSHIVTEEENKLTAYHEAGHALCSYYLPTQDRVQHITIIKRGNAGGFTMTLPEKDQSYVTKTWLMEEIVTLLGGRVAEKLILNEISTGAGSDIQRASSIARNMVTRYGFSDRLGPIVYGHEQSEVFLGRDFSSTPAYSETTAAEIDEEVHMFVEDAYQKALELLSEHIEKLHEVAKYLILHETIDGPDFEKLMKGELPLEAEKSDEAVGEKLDITIDDETSENDENSENN